MKEKNKIYTAADFARYHSGTMPADEMHALEKAALEDPFIEDALEGFTHTTTPENDLAELRSRLDEKRKRRKVIFPAPFSTNIWWRVAALFILICGAGYLFYKINDVREEKALAKVDAKIQGGKKDSIVSLKTDTAAANNEAVFEKAKQQSVALKEKPPLLSRSRSGKEVPAPVPMYERETPHENVSSLKDSSNNYSVMSSEADKEKAARIAKEYELKGRVTDDKGAPVPFATVSIKSSRSGTTADADGQFLLQSKDSVITAMISATGYSSKSIQLNKDEQPTIAMNKVSNGLSEVVVTSNSKVKQSKKAAFSSRELNKRIDGVETTADSTRHSENLDKFDHYLKENTRPVFDDNNIRATGEVLLSFTINKKARPGNIKVVTSSCKPCEAEAIKLLHNGPGWTGEKGSQATVVIKF